MASLSDVENALIALIAAQIYPNGTPPAGTSVVGCPVKIYAGWPDPDTLDADLVETAGVPVACHVSIYPLPAERNTTRFETRWEENPIPLPTYTIVVDGQEIVITGAAPNPYDAQNFCAYVDAVPYIVQAAAGAAAGDVAAALCAAIQAGGVGATVSGGIISLPSNADVGPVIVGTTGSVTKEPRRQEKQFQIAVWASNPTLRATIADLFDPVMADTPRLALPSGAVGQLCYHATRDDDFTQKQRIYRRSLIYAVEYPTTRTMSAAQLLVTKVTVEDPFGAPILGDLDFTVPDNVVFTGVV